MDTDDALEAIGEALTILRQDRTADERAIERISKAYDQWFYGDAGSPKESAAFRELIRAVAVFIDRPEPDWTEE